jgi:hypothetical protein
MCGRRLLISSSASGLVLDWQEQDSEARNVQVGLQAAAGSALWPIVVNGCCSYLFFTYYYLRFNKYILDPFNCLVFKGLALHSLEYQYPMIFELIFNINIYVCIFRYLVPRNAPQMPNHVWMHKVINCIRERNANRSRRFVLVLVAVDMERVGH